MKITLSNLHELTHIAVSSYGYTEEETKIISNVLLYSQLRGGNQGVAKLIGGGIPKSIDTKPVEIEKETKCSALLNAHETHAMIAISEATTLAIKKAKEHEIGIVGVHHINTSSGALGYYAKQIADAGFIGLIFAGSMETVTVEGSYEPLLGTNPLAFAAPTEHEPFIFDMATSAMPYYGVVEADASGRQLPSGIAYDKHGKTTISPKDVLEDGALRTFQQGYKGMGLSMMVQMLTGPLTGSYFTGIGDVKTNWGGHLIVALDPNMLGGSTSFRQGVTQMIERIKTAKRLPETKEILVPGEHGNKHSQNALKTGEIEIEENLYRALKEKATL